MAPAPKTLTSVSIQNLWLKKRYRPPAYLKINSLPKCSTQVGPHAQSVQILVKIGQVITKIQDLQNNL